MSAPTNDEMPADPTGWVDCVEERRREARILLASGVRLYPVGPDKKPLGQWARGVRNWVRQPATLDDVDDWLARLPVKGWAMLGGAKDDGVAAIDIEAAGMEHDECLGLLSALPDSCQRPSRNGGAHAYISVTDGDPLPTQKLARVDGVLLAEVRGVSKGDGAGAYAVVTGPGRGRLPDDFALAQVTRARADSLLSMVRALHEETEADAQRDANRAKSQPAAGKKRGSTSDVLYQAVESGLLDWLAILEPGWSKAGQDGAVTYFLRPGDVKSEQSGNALGANLTIHSAEVSWAPTGVSMNPARVLAECWFTGDHGAAMRASEQAAHGLVEDGVAPDAPFDSWPVEVLRQVHDARLAHEAHWKLNDDWVAGWDDDDPEQAARSDARGEDHSDQDDDTNARGEGSNVKATPGRHDRPGPSMRERLVKLTLSAFTLGITADERVFIVENDGPNVALTSAAAKSRITALMYARHGIVVGRGPRDEAWAVIEGMALSLDRVRLPLRVAEHDGSVVIDIGDPAGRAIVVTPDGWNVVDRSPVTFRRTKATMPLPTPARGGDTDALWSVVNVRPEHRHLFTAHLVGMLEPTVPHGIMLFRGEPGAAKTTTARIVARLIDPCTVAEVSPPKDSERWTSTASARHVVPVDNVSSIPDWWSDDLCRTVTGAGAMKRALYTDDDVTSSYVKACVILSGISLSSAMRGDLAERLVPFDLLRPEHRLTESEVDALVDRMQPAVLGALLDLLAGTHASRPRDCDPPRRAHGGRRMVCTRGTTPTSDSPPEEPSTPTGSTSARRSRRRWRTTRSPAASSSSWQAGPSGAGPRRPCSTSWEGSVRPCSPTGQATFHLAATGRGPRARSPEPCPGRALCC